MLFTVHIPLADVRSFLSTDSFRLQSPMWPAPCPRKDFVRGFGQVTRRRQGGLKGWAGEDVYCNADHALRFATDFGAHPPLDAKWFCAFRRLFASGSAVARVEVGLARSNNVEFDDVALLAFIHGVLTLPVSIPSKEADRGSQPLGEAGPRLAAHYLSSTTRSRVDPVQHWWVTSGGPLVVIEVPTPPLFARKLPLTHPAIHSHDHYLDFDEIDLHYYLHEQSDIPIWFINAYDTPARELARRLRLYLVRLHSEHQVLRQVLALINTDRLVVQRGTRGSDELQRYLAYSLHFLSQESKYGFDSSPILEVVQHVKESVAEGERASLIAKLASIRRNILNQLKGSFYLRPSARLAPLTARIFLQTPFDRLQTIINDYSEQENVFRHGRVNLVDTLDHEALSSMPSEDAAVYRKEHASVMRYFLEVQQRVPSVSIIIPVKGRKEMFLRTVRSLLCQTFLIHRPERVECLFVQDGLEEEAGANPISDEFFRLIEAAPRAARFRLFRLRKARGRASTRNVGVFHARNQVVLFVDASMVLEATFLAEQMLRHDRCRNQVALLGFKENISAGELDCASSERGPRKPNYRRDWKYLHTLTKDEADFDYEGHHYATEDTIRYMNVTNWLGGLPASGSIGKRTVPTFFQTNISSAPLHVVKQVGGFATAFDPMWGFEDSCLGALLLAQGVHLVPCPSSVAFKIEHPEDETKWFDIERHRSLFHELLTKTRMEEWCYERLEDHISNLKHELEELTLPAVEVRESEDPSWR